MTPLQSEEMLKLFEEQTNGMAQSEPSPTMTSSMSSPSQAGSPLMADSHQPVPNLISTLLQQSTPVTINSQHTDCNGFTSNTASQLLTLLKPPDVTVTSASNTTLPSVNNPQESHSNNLQTISITESSLTEVLNQMLAGQHDIRKTEPMVTSAPFTISESNSTSNQGLTLNAFSSSQGIMVTSSGLQTNSFASNMSTETPAVTLSNTGLINVISGGISIPVKISNILTGGQQANPQTESVLQNQRTTMSSAIGSIISSSIVTASPATTNQSHIQQSQGDLPADLANVNLQMFPPVSSFQSGNIGPQSVLVSITNRQTNSDVPPTNTPASFNQGPYSVSSSNSNTGFLNVEIPDQTHAEIRDILVSEAKPKLTLQTSTARSEQQHSMLRQMLTNTNDIDNSSLSPSPVSSPEGNIPESVSSISSPNSVFHDPVSQLTLINKSADLHIDGQDDDDAVGMWDISCFKTDPLDVDVPSKVQKSTHHSDAHSDAHSDEQSEISVEKLFDAGGADSTMDFKFTKFGQDNSALFTFGTPKTVNASPSTTDVRPAAETGSLKSMAPPIHKPHGRKVKDTGLGVQFPSRTPHYELKIVSQPEEQHRARYLTEGSRGAVKDRSQQSHPVVKLIGHSDLVTLQVFVGNETGRVKPHGFYQACKVCGKNSTPSIEKEIDGTVVIETEMSPANDMVVSVDCVGILKLRNADVEKRIGLAKARAKKKNSTRARLIFRVTFQKPDGNYQTLQVASSPIICTQPVGQPEISRMSLEEAPVTGGQDLFIIGKNFLKGTQVKFQEVSTEDGNTLWEKEADIDQEFFQQTHLICKIPEYRVKNIAKSVLVQIVIICRGKMSELQQFHYNPLPEQQQQQQQQQCQQQQQQQQQHHQQQQQQQHEVPMETDQAQSKNSLPCVSPVALELNRLVEQTQSSPAANTSLFQLPPGTVPGITQNGVATTLASRIPTQAVLPIVKQEVEMAGSPQPTPMEMTSVSSPQHQQQACLQQQQQQQSCFQQQQQQQQTQQSPANNIVNKALLDLLNASSQQAIQTVPTSCSQQNPGIILLSNNGQTTPTTTTPNNVLTSHAMQGIVQAPPMIVILPGNNQNAAPAVQAPVVQANVQQSVESILKSLFSQQNGLC